MFRSLEEAASCLLCACSGVADCRGGDWRYCSMASCPTSIVVASDLRNSSHWSAKVPDSTGSLLALEDSRLVRSLHSFCTVSFQSHSIRTEARCSCEIESQVSLKKKLKKNVWSLKVCFCFVCFFFGRGGLYFSLKPCILKQIVILLWSKYSDLKLLISST